MDTLTDDTLALLQCPETGGTLKRADDALVGQLRERLKSQRLVDRKGSHVRGRIDSALVREDEAVCYLVNEGIIDLAAHAGIALPLPRN